MDEARVPRDPARARTAVSDAISSRPLFDSAAFVNAERASRSLMARLSPKHLGTEMFGLYALTGKSLAFLGPILFAAATDAFDSQRAGMATVIGFWLAGGALLLTVEEPPKAR